VERTCTMPVGTKLFFPVVNQSALPFFENETPQGERQKAIEFMDAVLDDPDFSVTVDGEEVKSNRIGRVRSLPFFTVTMPEENVFDQFVTEGVPGDKYEGWTTDGLWVTLPPLPPGEHTTHFELSAQTENFGLVTQNVTYHMTVVNKR
jgi:hypothetical protein